MVRSPEMGRRAIAAPLLVAGFLLAALAYLWPLPRHLHDAFVYPSPDTHPLAVSDSTLTAWMLAWSAHALRTAPWRLFDANIVYPIPNALAFSEHMVGAAVLVLPLQLLGTDPIRDQNALLMLTLALSGVGTVWLVRELGGSWPAAVVAGVLFTFGPWRLGELELGHVQMLACHGMPFTLVFLHRLLRTGRWRDGIGFTAAFVLHALTSVYHAYYFGFAVASFAALHWLLGRPAAPGARRRLVFLCGVIGVLLVPTFLPYVAARERYALARAPSLAIRFAAVGDTYVGALHTPIDYLTTRYGGTGSTTAAVGLGTLVLAALGLFGGAGERRDARRVAWLYGLLAATAAVLSLGPIMRMSNVDSHAIPGPYSILTAIVPGMDALRVPSRMALTAYLALAVLAGLGVDMLLRHAPGRVRRGIVILLLAVMVLAEVWRPALHVHALDWLGETADAYAWLAAQPGDAPTLELPMGAYTWDVRYMVLSARHWKRLMNGRSSFTLSGPYFRRVFATFPDPPSLRLLHRLGGRYVLLHDAWMPRPRCAALVGRPPPWLALRWHDDRACLFEVLGAPSETPRARDREVALDGVTLRTSNGDDASAAVDGDPTTHWIQAVERNGEGWLEIAFPEAHALTNLTLRLGPHFGDYLRIGRIEGLLRSGTWAPLVPSQLLEPPLLDLTTRPDDLRAEIALPGTEVNAVRLVRPAFMLQWQDVFRDWARWGVHELAFREAVANP